MIMLFAIPSWIEENETYYVGNLDFGDLDFDAAWAKITSEVVDQRMCNEYLTTPYGFGKLFKVVFVSEVFKLRANKLKKEWGKEKELKVDYETSEEAFYSAVKRISEMKLKNFSYC